jgi:hypothetical protein
MSERPIDDIEPDPEKAPWQSVYNLLRRAYTRIGRLEAEVREMRAQHEVEARSLQALLASLGDNVDD